MNNKNKNFWKILVVLLLSILHVCASAYTVNNAMNPLLILLYIYIYCMVRILYLFYWGNDSPVCCDIFLSPLNLKLEK